MLQNYLKIALRNLQKNKGFSFINIFGLTIGLTCCLLIGIFILNELSFDRYHTNADRIWRVSRKFKNPDGSNQLHLGHLAPPFAPLLKNDFPDIEEATRLLQSGGTFQREDKVFQEEFAFFAEPSIFRIFDIPFIKGDPASALDAPLSVVLNETTARKYFPEGDAVNRTLKVNGRFEVKVTGVYKDFPYNSHFHPTILISFATLNNEQVYGEEQLRTNWGNNSFSTFLLLPENYPAENLEAQFPAFLDKHMGSMSTENEMPMPSVWTSLHLMPLTDIHLHSHLDSEIEENGDINRVYIFSMIALFVLLIACINYMNLSTARSANRGKEIGIRKVSGAFKGELIGQFLSESVLLTLFAMFMAGLLAASVLPYVNQLLGQNLSVSSAQAGGLLLAMAILALLTGLLAGVYPAFFMSAMKPVEVLKGKSVSGSRGGAVLLRKTLVVGQFAISAGLIIATMVVYRQLQFLQNKKLGLEKDHVITMYFNQSLAPRYEGFLTEMLANPLVQNVARSSRIPSSRLLDSMGSADVQLDTDSLEQTNISLKYLTIDHRFASLYGLEIAAGRNYRDDQGADRTGSFILNESAIRQIGFAAPEEAVGKRINYGNRDAHIVGVFKDFNFESLHQDITPMIFFIPSDSSNFRQMSLKLDGQNTQAALAHVKSVWEKFQPEFPFEFQFLDDRYARLYEAEQRQGKVFIGFAVLAIIVACLGLFGLASFVTQQRVKEIGVRKVLGATTAGIVGLLSKDFLKLVFISLIIASPIAWWAMNKWLQDFAYRIDIAWWIFALAGAVAVGVAFFTVSFQSVKAALANPVKSLRSE